jgi:anti-sigma B factor antagonist
MRLEASEFGGVTVLRLSGAVQGEDNAGFAERLGALRASGARLVAIDAAGLEYINSRAIGELVLLNHELGGRGGALALAGLCPAVEKIVRAVGLGALVGLHADLAAALAAWGVAAPPPAPPPARPTLRPRPAKRPAGRRRRRG